MTYSQSFIVYFQWIYFSKLIARGSPGNLLNIHVSSIPSFSWRYSLCQPSSDYSPSYPLFYHEVFYLFLSCSSPAAVHRDGTTVWLSRSNNYQGGKENQGLQCSQLWRSSQLDLSYWAASRICFRSLRFWWNW